MFSATIDLSKTYNRVNRAKLRHKLKKMQIPTDLIHMIKSTYKEHTETYQVGRERTKAAKMDNDLRQGSVLSPLLFIIYVNQLIENIIKTHEGIFFRNPTSTMKRLPYLMFVDDLHIMADSLAGLTTIIDIVTQRRT